MIRVHRVNFFEPQPNSIQCLAYDTSISRLAVSRSDFSIEIWEMQSKPYLEKKIHGSMYNSVESVAWCSGRLFSVGGHGTLTEYDLNYLKPKFNMPVASGSPLWCLSVNKQKTLLAMGNEDGHVILYQITSEGVEYERKFDKQEGRILCLSWHASGETIVTGSIDAIRVWNVSTGQVKVRIIVGRNELNEETVVWCLAITSDMTIISGDSRGKTSFWEAKTGTLISSLGAHKAHVLTLSLSEDENTVFTSGTDPVMMMFMRSEIQSADGTTKKRWMKSVQRILHTHDVRSLQLVGEYLVSGGIDCNLVFSKYPPKTSIHFFPFTQLSHCSVSSQSNCVLLRYSNYLEVWKLGKSDEVAGLDGDQLPLSEQPQKLIRLNAKPADTLLCSTISSDGKWIAYSSLNKLRLFYIENENETPVIQKVALPKHLEPAYNLFFASSDNKLVIYDKCNIHVVKCDSLQADVICSTEEEIGPNFHLFDVSSDLKYLACGSHEGKISIYDFHTLKLLFHLPQYIFQATALKFDATAENLLAIYSDRKIIEYNLKKQGYTKFTRDASILNLQSNHHPITGIVLFDDKILIQDEASVYVIEKDFEENSETKKLKSSDGPENSKFTLKLRQIVEKYKHISSIHSLNDDLVVIEVPPTHILSTLQPPLQKKMFGT